MRSVKAFETCCNESLGIGATGDLPLAEGEELLARFETLLAGL